MPLQKVVTWARRGVHRRARHTDSLTVRGAVVVISAIRPRSKGGVDLARLEQPFRGAVPGGGGHSLRRSPGRGRWG